MKMKSIEAMRAKSAILSSNAPKSLDVFVFLARGPSIRSLMMHRMYIV